MPIPPVPTAEWVEKYFNLPPESGEIVGRYQLRYAPYMLGIYNALDDPGVNEVVVSKAAQVGWTVGLVGYIGRLIHTDPCAIMMMFPAAASATEFNDEKFKPAVEATPVLAERVDVSSNRVSGNRSSFRKFAGGFLKLVGGKTARQAKSTTARVVLVEEPDDTTENAGGQGDVITMLWERTKRIRNSKRVLGGTPGVKGLSRVDYHLQASDQRVLPITCHECGESAPLEFENVSWLEGDPNEGAREHEVYGYAQPETAVYACPFCGSGWSDYQRKENIRDTISEAAERGDPMGGWNSTAEFSGTAGFKELNELYSCLPGAGLADIVRDHLKAEHLSERGDEREKIVFVNSKLARAYEYTGSQLDADALRELAEDYRELVCPREGLLITIGIDVQHDRVAIVIRAWGRGQESWLLYWGEISAKVAVVDVSDPVWVEAEYRCFSAIEHETGNQIFARALTIDCSDGTTSDAVYAIVRSWVKKYPHVQVMAGKGSSSQGDPEIFVTPRAKSVDHHNPKKQTKADRFGVKVYQIGTNKAKDLIAARLKLEGRGDGRFHYYKDVRTDYFDQMTGEVKAPHRTIRNRKIWQQKAGCAVEAWDCEVYALHAARAVRVHLLKDAQWDALEQKLLQSDLFSAPAEKVAAAPTKGSVKTKSKPKVSMADLGRSMGS